MFTTLARDVSEVLKQAEEKRISFSQVTTEKNGNTNGADKLLPQGMLDGAPRVRRGLAEIALPSMPQVLDKQTAKPKDWAKYAARMTNWFVRYSSIALAIYNRYDEIKKLAKYERDVPFLKTDPMTESYVLYTIFRIADKEEDTQARLFHLGAMGIVSKKNIGFAEENGLIDDMDWGTAATAWVSSRIYDLGNNYYECKISNKADDTRSTTKFEPSTRTKELHELTCRLFNGDKPWAILDSSSTCCSNKNVNESLFAQKKDFDILSRIRAKGKHSPFYSDYISILIAYGVRLSGCTQ